MDYRKIRQYAFFVLAFNIFVMVFGAFVRASGSGAGCGSHWPLCNGVVVPRAPALETIIEFTHRITSGMTIILIIILAILVYRAFAKGHPARKAVVWVVVFIIVESLIGAVLVLFDLVVHNTSAARVFAMITHLVNTLLLLGSLTLVIWTIRPKVESIPPPARLKLLLVLGLGAVVLTTASGAIAALGDTIFPDSSLLSGLQQDFSETAHILVRLRVYHPVIAVFTGLFLIWSGLQFRKHLPARLARPLVTGLVVLVAVQLLAGLVNVILLAPIWMQLVHLSLTTFIWITYVTCGILLWMKPDLPAGIGQKQVENGIHQPAA